MLNLVRYQAAIVSAIFVFCGNVAVALPVIPGAAGFGIDTPAGRGGKVIRVTTLNDSGTGSLRACVKTSGPRICVFEVSGTIQLNGNLVITDPYLTIAGQTAPSPGVMLRGASLAVAASNVLVQHIAVRAGDDPDGPPAQSRDSLKINGGSRNVVIDHCSFSWALDENIETYKNWNDVTISNTIISEALNAANRFQGGAHAYGALLHTTDSSSRISVIGNLFAHNDARNPRTNAANFVFVNNVVYNPGSAAIMLFNTDIPSNNVVVGNVFIKGSNTKDAAMPIRLNNAGASGLNEMLAASTLYLNDNLSWLSSKDPWAIVDNDSTFSLGDFRVSSAALWPTGLKALSTSGGAVLNYVLKNAGARPDRRDSVDARIVSDVKKGTGSVVDCVASNGSSICSKNAGGWPVLAENTHVLNIPGNANDDDDRDGYTNLEEWLHELAAEVEGRSGSVDELAAPLPPTLQD